MSQPSDRVASAASVGRPCAFTLFRRTCRPLVPRRRRFHLAGLRSRPRRHSCSAARATRAQTRSPRRPGSINHLKRRCLLPSSSTVSNNRPRRWAHLRRLPPADGLCSASVSLCVTALARKTFAPHSYTPALPPALSLLKPRRPAPNWARRQPMIPHTTPFSRPSSFSAQGHRR
jgi:hypothetical protein